MTTRTINDAESITRQQALLSAMTERAAYYADLSGAEGAHGHGAYAVEFALLANCCRRVADRTRGRLVEVTELAVSDVQADEPPATLVDLVGWLREKIGKFFPRVPVEIWQGIGMVLHSWRGRS